MSCHIATYGAYCAAINKGLSPSEHCAWSGTNVPNYDYTDCRPGKSGLSTHLGPAQFSISRAFLLRSQNAVRAKKHILVFNGSASTVSRCDRERHIRCLRNWLSHADIQKLATSSTQAGRRAIAVMPTRSKSILKALKFSHHSSSP